MLPGDNSRSIRANRAWVPNLVLLVSILLTGLATFFIASEAEGKDQVRFENAVHRVGDSITRRVDVFVTMLRGARGVFLAEGEVSRADFREFVTSLDLRALYPGVQGVGFASRVDASTRDAIVAEARSSGLPEFRVWPDERDGWAPYTTIVYLEPPDARNAAAMGFDMFSEQVRREAMETARDTGLTTVSGKVVLKQEIDDQKQAGFLIYTPVYRDGAPTGSVAERREALGGYVYIPLRADDLWTGIFGTEPLPGVDFEVFDGDGAAPERLLYDSRRLEGADPVATPRFVTSSAIELPGRRWTVVCSSNAAFERASGRSFAAYTLVAGLAVSLLLFLISSGQVKARATAESAMANLLRSQEALRSSESRMRRLVESNIVGIVIVDFDGRVTDANDAFLSMIGYSRDDLLAGEIELDRISPPHSRKFDAAMFAELKRTGARPPFEAAYVRKDGVEVPVLEGLAHLEGERDAAVGFVVDLTERKRVELERAQLLERERHAREIAEEANRVKDEFLATVSHELRTPLNAMLGWSRLLRTTTLDPEKVDRAIETIERNARSQAQLIEDLLDVSRIMSGKLRLRVKTINLATAVEGALEAIGPAALAKRITVDARLDPNTGAVTGDATRLQQVVWNLLSNAVKFTPPGGTVRVSLRPVDSHAELEVADTGPGIAPAFLPHVFDRFRQEDSSLTRTHGGLGLGLAIVRHLTEMHGGTVTAASGGVGHGATFTIRLPLSEIRADDSRPRDAASAVSLDGTRVLVVDDDPDSRDIVAEVLQHHGATTVTCPSLRQALSAIEEFPPDVLISDIAMADGDGYELIRAVRALDGAAGSVPAIALSAYSRPDDRRRAINAGFQEHLAKPFDAGRLVEAIARLAGSAPHTRA